MDHTDLPEPAQDLIKAAELTAESIFETCDQEVKLLRHMAAEGGVDPLDIGFSPGRPALDAARNRAAECPREAATFLFKTVAEVYWKHLLVPDVEAFAAKVDAVWQWAHQKFRINIGEIPLDTKRNWLAWAYQDRATRCFQKPGLPDAGTENNKALRESVEGTTAEPGDRVSGPGCVPSVRDIETALNQGSRKQAVHLRRTLDQCTTQDLWSDAFKSRRGTEATKRTAFNRWHASRADAPSWADELMRARLLR